MRRVLLALLLLPALATAQGGFGGMQQGRQGRAGGEEVQRRPENEDEGLWTERSAIVTPGDRVEYRFELKAGETVFAAATSDAFDPGLAFADAKGKVLRENDDRAEGDQSPFLAFRAPADGTYTLKVVGFRSAAGGRFTLKFRTFTPLDAPLGTTVAARKAPAPDDGRTMVRVAAKKGEAVDLSAYGTRGPNGPTFPLGSSLVVGPTGVDRNDLTPTDTPDGSRVFRAQADGDYYVQFVGTGGVTSVRLERRAVATVMAKTTEEAAFNLAPGELRLVEFPVEPDAIVRTTLAPGPYAVRFDAPPGPSRGQERSDPGYGEAPGFTWFRLDRDSDADVVRIFHGKGTARYAFRAASDRPQRIVLRNTESLPEWTPDAALTGDLDIGQVRLFRLRTAPSEIMHVAAKGERFQVRLDLFGTNGWLEQTLMDRQRHVAEGDLYYAEAQTTLVRLLCDGYGGAGTYTLRRDVAKPTPYTLGTTATVNLPGPGFALYGVELVGGQRYALTRDHPDHGLDLTILADDGTGVGVQTVNFDPVQTSFFTPPKSGRYRLWFRGGPGEWRFRLAPYAPPAVDGS